MALRLFQHSLRVPETVDSDKIEAHFKKRVLAVTLSKTREAQKAVQKIEVNGRRILLNPRS